MISDLLTTTPQNKRVLAGKAGTTTREVELAIHAARLEGVPIASNGDGYYLTDDPAEVAACAKRLRSRAVNHGHDQFGSDFDDDIWLGMMILIVIPLAIILAPIWATGRLARWLADR